MQISADGQRVSDNDYMIDGVSVNSLTHGGAAVVTPNQEAVGAITIVSTSYDASLGRNTGAQIQVVTKSGTNSLHGSAFFLYDNPGFNSYNKYGGSYAPGTLPLRNDNAERNWAASLGGPIVRDKLFFFASYQEYKQKRPKLYHGLHGNPAVSYGRRGMQRPGGVSAGIIAHAGSAARVLKVITPSCTGFGTYATGPAVGGVTTDGACTCQVVNGGLRSRSLHFRRRIPQLGYLSERKRL